MHASQQLILETSAEPLADDASLRDFMRCLKESPSESNDTEDMPGGPAEDFPLETAGFDPFEFQLANSHDVRLVYAKFWQPLTLSDRRAGALPCQYSALKVYSTQDMTPRRMALQCEFRPGKDMAVAAVPLVWEWLEERVSDRTLWDYDDLDEFLDDLAESIVEFSETGEDAVLHFRHLPEIALPDAFDKIDDSLFNDQNDGENG